MSERTASRSHVCCLKQGGLGCSAMPTCCAVGCSSSIAKGDKLFVVPRGKNNEERRAVWLHRIGRKNFDCHRGRLCEKHFTMDQYEPAILAQTGIKKLKPNAVSSIFAHRPLPKERKPPAKGGMKRFLLYPWMSQKRQWGGPRTLNQWAVYFLPPRTTQQRQ
ncbi:uncharacterized protein LOC142818143 [Rhipicephalus microplus]|uniref:uncharacterized protein LOC142818143 n=1 Tax=Rhipicephalus microplus TaxID=6941 RepID=UPI003F6D696A